MSIDTRLKKLEHQMKNVIDETKTVPMSPQERRDRIEFLWNKLVEGMNINDIQNLYTEYLVKHPAIATVLKERYGDQFTKEVQI